jgi:alkylhydroperoxidase family enzyme
MRTRKQGVGRSYDRDSISAPTSSPPSWAKAARRVVLRTNDCDFGVVRTMRDKKDAKKTHVCWKTSRGYQTTVVRTECIREEQEVGA